MTNTSGPTPEELKIRLDKYEEMFKVRRKEASELTWRLMGDLAKTMIYMNGAGIGLVLTLSSKGSLLSQSLLLRITILCFGISLVFCLLRFMLAASAKSFEVDWAMISLQALQGSSVEETEKRGWASLRAYRKYSVLAAVVVRVAVYSLMSAIALLIIYFSAI